MITVQITYNDGSDNTVDIVRTERYSVDGRTKDQVAEAASFLASRALDAFHAAVKS